MCWSSKSEKYFCKDCNKEFEFKINTLFIASHGGLPIKCSKCKSENIGKVHVKSDLIGKKVTIMHEFNY